MTFGAPWLLLSLLLVPLAVLAYVHVTRLRARRAGRLAADGLVPISTGRSRPWHHLPFVLLALALARLCVGLARPVATIAMPVRQGTVILAFDVSNSMRADDIEPTRIDAAKVAATAFAERQPDTIKLGVVSFGESAVTVLRPTTTTAQVVAAIDRLSVGGGTSLGQGLFTALGTIAGEPLTIDPESLEGDGGDVDIGYFGSAAVVMLSDGENTSQPDPLTIAEIAATAGVKVHTIGLGSPQGTTVEVDGFTLSTALDEEVLGGIAETTDGRYQVAADAAALQRIYESIDLDVERVEEEREITALFAASGALLIAASVLLSAAWFGRVL